MHYTQFDIGDEVILSYNGQQIKTTVVGVYIRKKLLRFKKTVDETVSYEVDAFPGDKFHGADLTAIHF